MNLITGEIEDIAEMVKLRISTNRVTYSVYADNDGKVILDRTHDPRRSMMIPDAYLVGVYTRKAKVLDIEDDLVARLREIAA